MVKPGSKSRFFPETIAILVVLVLLPTGLNSQISFGVTTIRFDLKVKPGGQTTEIIQVRNNSPKPIRLKVYAENWYLAEDGTRNFVGNQPVSFSCRDWIKVNPFDFRLQPEDLKTVRFTVTVPSGTEPGGYHAAISFEQIPESPVSGINQVALSGKIVVAIYISVGKVQPEGTLEDLVFESSGSGQLIKLKLINSGRTHFRLKGQIQIRTEEGKELARVDIPDEPVLPDSQRWLSLRLKENLPPGRYEAEARLDIGRDELLGLIKEITVR